MLDERNLQDVSIGGDERYTEIVDAFMPRDDISQRSDLSMKQIQALAYLQYLVTHYKCKRIGILCDEFMRLRRSLERKSSVELAGVFKTLLFQRRFDEGDSENDRRLDEMVK